MPTVMSCHGEPPHSPRGCSPVITVYQYLSAWGLPCISPFVTKVVFYMRMTGIPFVLQRQDLHTLDHDSPTGKLPYIVDAQGQKIGDSNRIIAELKACHGDPLDADATPAERAGMHAWTRMIDEHLYWTAIVQSRWRDTRNWNRYLDTIAGDDCLSEDEERFLQDFRFRILSEFMHGGWGRLQSAEIGARARADIDALSDALGEQSFLMGQKPRSLDATLYSILRHIIDSPFESEVRAHAASKRNLACYMQRMYGRFGI